MTSILTKKIDFNINTKLCLKRNIPYLGICRGSQVLNVACGGTLYQDVEREFSKNCPELQRLMKHIDYDNYDRHGHVVKVIKNTPTHQRFNDSLEKEKMEIWVNSYHHQGVKRLAHRFVPMAFGLDGLVEGFYDPDAYNPEEGKFIMGLQFHPERMRNSDTVQFDYPGCPKAYQSNTALSLQQETRLKQMGAKVRNSGLYFEQMKLNEQRERLARIVMEKMSVDQLSDLMAFYHMMGQICSEVLEKKLSDIVNDINS